MISKSVSFRRYADDRGGLSCVGILNVARLAPSCMGTSPGRTAVLAENIHGYNRYLLRDGMGSLPST